MLKLALLPFKGFGVPQTSWETRTNNQIMWCQLRAALQNKTKIVVGETEMILYGLHANCVNVELYFNIWLDLMCWLSCLYSLCISFISVYDKITHFYFDLFLICQLSCLGLIMLYTNSISVLHHVCIILSHCKPLVKNKKYQYGK